MVGVIGKIKKACDWFGRICVVLFCVRRSTTVSLETRNPILEGLPKSYLVAQETILIRFVSCKVTLSWE